VGVVGGATSLSLSSSASEGGLGMSVPLGTNATVMSWCSLSRILPGAPLTRRPTAVGDRDGQTLTCTSAGLPPHFWPFFFTG
jgi:hypothetical protein